MDSEIIQTWRISFALVKGDESLVQYVVKSETGDTFKDKILTSELLEDLQGWSGMPGGVLQQLRSALVQGHEYTAMLRTTRNGLRGIGLFPRIAR